MEARVGTAPKLGGDRPRISRSTARLSHKSRCRASGAKCSLVDLSRQRLSASNFLVFPLPSIVLTLYMLRPPVDYFLTSCRHPSCVCVSSLDQTVFVRLVTFRAHSLFMVSQEKNLSDPYIATMVAEQLR